MLAGLMLDVFFDSAWFLSNYEDCLFCYVAGEDNNFCTCMMFKFGTNSVAYICCFVVL